MKFRKYQTNSQIYFGSTFFHCTFKQTYKPEAMIKENLSEFIERSIKMNWEIEALADYKGGTYKYKEVGDKMARIHLVFANS